ncbi:MAG: oxygen-independent coproporphyrinogen III oxidase [Pseudomonadota bacterium]
MQSAERQTDAHRIERFSKPVPRYTSYPTAPHFHEDITASDYRAWLAGLDRETAISLYVHIPFCDRLCWFCGCTTKQIARYDPVPLYLKHVHAELDLVRAAIGFRPSIHHLHLGGGSPSMVLPSDLERLRRALDDRFDFTDDACISIEIDPSDKADDALSGLRAMGMTRASIGVQDFEPRVQEAINRPQSFAETARTVDALRSIGVHSLNIDALYGLPYQTEQTVEDSLAKVVSLEPDRIALFGYAHVPWMKKHQTLIPEEALPGPLERFAQARLAADILIGNGYVPIGIDHFARPTDSLARAATDGGLRRNFQGYTDDSCMTLVGIGASSIGRLPQGYVQNETATGTYMRRVAAGELPIARGVALTAEDHLCSDVIEDLMCRFGFSLKRVAARHGRQADLISRRIAEAMRGADAELVTFDGDWFGVHPDARAFTRTVASWFDERLRQKAARYSMAV